MKILLKESLERAALGIKRSKELTEEARRSRFDANEEIQKVIDYINIYLRVPISVKAHKSFFGKGWIDTYDFPAKKFIADCTLTYNSILSVNIIHQISPTEILYDKVLSFSDVDFQGFFDSIKDILNQLIEMTNHPEYKEYAGEVKSVQEAFNFDLSGTSLGKLDIERSWRRISVAD